jgi:hypothetical protein
MSSQLMLITGTHPDTYTVDVEDWRTGWKMKGVAVLTGPATARTGVADLPVFTEAEPGYGLVEILDGGVPIVVGFLHSRVSQMRFADGRAILRHDSDVYLSIGRDGETELRHPSGAMIRIGENAAHEDLAGTDYDKTWSTPRNTGKDVKIVLQIGAVSVTISADGVAIESPSLTHNGQDVGDTHVHSGIVPGGGNTGVPA